MYEPKESTFYKTIITGETDLVNKGLTANVNDLQDEISKIRRIFCGV
jgi:hypothetical protein